MTRKYKLAVLLTDVLILLGFEVFMAVYFDVRYLFYNTIVTGGDMASWHGMADHMLTVLLPHGRLTGWDWGNFCGYPNFTFYFIPPFLLAVLPAYLLHIPLAVTLKLAMVLGMFLLPLTTYFSLRAMAYRFPMPVIGASGAMLFLFNESYIMFGGNALSTLTGEFCYMLAFSVFVYFIGSLYRGATGNQSAIKNGLLLGFIGLSHLFVFIPAASLLLYWLIDKGNVRYLAKVGITAFGLMAFWIVPLAVFRDPYTTPVYMIWQPFVSWRYTFMGIFLLLLFIGPSLSTTALGKEKSAPQRWHGQDVAILAFSGLFTFSCTYLALSFLVLGPGLWDAGLSLTPLSASPLGSHWASRLAAVPGPAALAAAAAVVALGLWSMRHGRFGKFALSMGQAALFLIFLLGSLGLYFLVASDPSLRGFWMRWSTLAFIVPLLAAGIFIVLVRVSKVLQASKKKENQRLRMLLALAFACVVGYFSAHFLEVPDIRFLPPLLFVLMLILFVDFLEPMISPSSQRTKFGWAVVVSYLSILVIVFSAQRADLWFRFNAKGYESMPGIGEFKALNDHLREAYGDPLNAPRVGYEKSNLYGRYGGDRVFESLRLFSGRQTMEGIHYASSMASRFIAFLQTAYSRDIKTPRSYILSKLDPEGLPAYFDLYNVSQLIAVSDEAKQAILSSPHFQKEKDFGPLSLFRYSSPSGQYVDVPRVRPVLYEGEKWVDDFVRWYKEGRFLDVLMVPQSYVRNPDDRSLFTSKTADTKNLESFRKDALDRQDLKIEAHLKPFMIEFATNKIGVPHLIKASYFPNWQAKGAHGVYPVSPHLMMVIPRQERVILSYGWTSWDYLGVAITLGTLVFILAVKIVGVIGKRGALTILDSCLRGNDERTLKQVEAARISDGRSAVFRLYLGLIVVFLCVALVISGALLRNKPVRTYVNGQKAYQRGNEFLEMDRVQAAKASFTKAVEIMAPMVSKRRNYDHQDVMNSILFTAMCHERLGEWNEAEALYRLILQEYPYSRYVAEAHVKLARASKRVRDQTIDNALSLLEQGNRAGYPLLREALHLSMKRVEHYKSARTEEPFSVWAQYALEDLDKDRAYFEQKAIEIIKLSSDERTREDLQSLLGVPARGGLPPLCPLPPGEGMNLGRQGRTPP